MKQICEQCGKEFKVKPSRIKYGGGKYCSKDCWNKKQSKKIEKICEICGKKIMVSPSRIRDNKKYFCSIKCKGLWLSENFKKNINPNWKGGKIKRFCQECNKEFYVSRYRIKIGCGNFCSISCASKVTRRKTKMPTHHTKPELIFEEICKKYNLDFHYVGDGSLWIGKKGEKRLNPDFIEANGKKICVEIMGDYWHSPLLNPKLPEQANLKYRERHYKKYKWESIFIWESDLKRPDAEQFVLNKFGD